MDNPTVAQVASKYGVSGAQVLLRWGIQKGIVVLPKSATTSRMESNLQLFEMELTPEDMAALDGLTTPESLSDFEAHFAKRAVVDPDAPTVDTYAAAAIEGAFGLL